MLYHVDRVLRSNGSIGTRNIEALLGVLCREVLAVSRCGHVPVDVRVDLRRPPHEGAIGLCFVLVDQIFLAVKEGRMSDRPILVLLHEREGWCWLEIVYHRDESQTAEGAAARFIADRTSNKLAKQLSGQIISADDLSPIANTRFGFPLVNAPERQYAFA